MQVFVCRECGEASPDRKMCHDQQMMPLDVAAGEQLALFELEHNEHAANVIRTLKATLSEKGQVVKKKEIALAAARTEQKDALQVLLDFYRLGEREGVVPDRLTAPEKSDAERSQCVEDAAAADIERQRTEDAQHAADKSLFDELVCRVVDTEIDVPDEITTWPEVAEFAHEHNVVIGDLVTRYEEDDGSLIRWEPVMPAVAEDGAEAPDTGAEAVSPESDDEGASEAANMTCNACDFASKAEGEGFQDDIACIAKPGDNVPANCPDDAFAPVEGQVIGTADIEDAAFETAEAEAAAPALSVVPEPADPAPEAIADFEATALARTAIEGGTGNRMIGGVRFISYIKDSELNVEIQNCPDPELARAHAEVFFAAAGTLAGTTLEWSVVSESLAASVYCATL